MARRIAALVVVAGLGVWPAAAQPAAPDTQGTNDASVNKPSVASVPMLPSWRADASAPYLTPDQAWPARVEVKGARGIIRDIPGDVHGWNQRFGFIQGLQPTEEDQADAAAFLAGLGHEEPIAFEGKGGYVVEFDGGHKSLFSQKVKRSDRPAMAFKYISAEREKNPAGGERLALQRTSFVFYDPYGDAEKMEGRLEHAQCRGVALVMPGLFGTPDTVIDVLVRRLRQEKWYVLRLLSASSRFTQTETYRVDAAGGVGEAAERMAATLGNRAAEIAYAVEAGFQHVFAARPEISGCPRVVIGASAGAITLPTVVARDPSRYAAAVLIGGGADFWLINWRSNYRRGVDAIRMEWTRGAPTEEQEKDLDRRYLERAPLDAFHTAGLLRGKPVLMVHGNVDRAVPAALGDLLWERLGKPERWSWPVGHEMLFFSVAGKLTELSEWLSRAADGVADHGGKP